MTDRSNPHRYGFKSRLSSAYTAGRDGKPAAPHFGDKTSAAYKAWKLGRDERACNTHDDMLAALKANLALHERRLQQAIRNSTTYGQIGGHKDKDLPSPSDAVVREQTRAAILKAEVSGVGQ